MDGMHREIVTDPLRGKDLRDDLTVNLSRMKALGLPEISLLFGFSWGNRIYEKDWKEIPVSPEQALSMVQRAEAQGFGEIGDDNLYVFAKEYNLRLLYSHEADIHLSFGTPNRLVCDILERWSASQWLCYTRNKALKEAMERSCSRSF